MEKKQVGNLSRKNIGTMCALCGKTHMKPTALAALYKIMHGFLRAKIFQRELCEWVNFGNKPQKIRGACVRIK